MHFDPLDHLPDVDPDAHIRAVPLSGRPLLKLLFGEWRTGAIGQSEYFQAWLLVWLCLGPVILLLGVLFLTSVLVVTDPSSIAIIAVLAATFIVLTANLSAKRARGKGLPAWIGPLTSLIGWVVVPFSKGAAAPLIGLGPVASSALIKRLAKKELPHNQE